MIAIKLYGFFCIILGASVFGAKTPDVKFNKITLEPKPGNLYFENWSYEISEPGDRVSVSFPVKEDLPENMMFKVVAYMNGNQEVAVEMEICEGIESGVIDKNFLDQIHPKDQFPKRCPITAGNFELRDYTFASANIPDGIPEGSYTVKYSLFMPDSEPEISWTLEGQLSWK